MESLKSALAPRAGSATALAELLSSFRTGRRARATGLHGAARGYALTHLARALKRSLVCVEPDEEAAEALERDLRFFWPQPDADTAIVRLPGDEVLPYEGLTPDPQAAMARLAGLFHLHLGNARVVVLSVRGLARRVLPREALDSRSLQLAVTATQDRDELAGKLTAAGYAKVPLVEDPGTFAVRGGVFDVEGGDGAVFAEDLAVEAGEDFAGAYFDEVGCALGGEEADAFDPADGSGDLADEGVADHVILAGIVASVHRVVDELL